MPTLRSSSLVVALCLVAGCQGREPVAGKGKSAATQKTDRATATAAASPSTAQQVDAEARALVAEWLRSQNAGQLDLYQALYHPARFIGVKRTSSGGLSKYDTAAWLKDRGRMFAKPQSVAAEQIELRSWLSGGSPSLPIGVTEVRYLQRWKNDKYADHGTKVLRLLREEGRQRIVSEVLLDSTKGWDEASSQKDESARLTRELESTPWNQIQERLETLPPATLRSLAELGTDCLFALMAAQTLAAQGDPSFMPRRGTINEPDKIARALCMIGQMKTGKQELLEDYLPPSGKFKVSARGICPEDEVTDHKLTRAEADGDEIPSTFRRLYPCGPDAGKGELVCTGVGTGMGTDVTLAPAQDGKLYIRAIETIPIIGCGC